MSEIVAAVQRVTDIIGEITRGEPASRATGIGQVNSAVTQIDQMTQQNAALVEESAAAAESLKEQADAAGAGGRRLPPRCGVGAHRPRSPRANRRCARRGR